MATLASNSIIPDSKVSARKVYLAPGTFQRQEHGGWAAADSDGHIGYNIGKREIAEAYADGPGAWAAYWKAEHAARREREDAADENRKAALRLSDPQFLHGKTPEGVRINLLRALTHAVLAVDPGRVLPEVTARAQEAADRLAPSPPLDTRAVADAAALDTLAGAYLAADQDDVGWSGSDAVELVGRVLVETGRVAP